MPFKAIPIVPFTNFGFVFLIGFFGTQNSTLCCLIAFGFERFGNLPIGWSGILSEVMHYLFILCEIETSFLADAEFKAIKNEKIKNKVFTIDFSLNLQSKFLM